ncbi:MAG: hypothetical protein J6P36_08635, partial [Lachnospiraceae bacterium]|nr:hypothetical protein [Lachnospiraceae bacterium]
PYPMPLAAPVTSAQRFFTEIIKLYLRGVVAVNVTQKVAGFKAAEPLEQDTTSGKRKKMA